MNITDSLKHNLKCWKSDIDGIDKMINFLKGKKEALEGTVECLEIILKEQSNEK